MEPEWQRWDAPYFHEGRARSEVSLEAYRERAAGQATDPDTRIIALDGECIGQVSRYWEAPQAGGWLELGILIFDPQHWGSGLGSAALHQWT